MNQFMKAALDSRAERKLTENGGETFSSSSRASVDLFFQIGALRGQKDGRLQRLFEAAFQENAEHAIRTILWARDVRGGAGERQIFRDLLTYMEVHHEDELDVLIPFVPEYGRWDDLLVFQHDRHKNLAFEEIRKALESGTGSASLAAKWMPRKGPVALQLQNYLGFSPKRYRKTLVTLTKVVEQQMCAKQWGDVNYEHVPSLAMTRYTKAFNKHDATRFSDFVNKVKTGDAKVNVGAIYPYDITTRILDTSGWSFQVKQVNKAELDLWTEQWKALPNFLGEHAVIPVVDISGSMSSQIPGSKSLRCIDISVALGLYLADKQEGPFKDLIIPFNDHAKFVHLKGNIAQKIRQMMGIGFGMNTNIEAAFRLILKTALANNVSADDMPRTLVILSDMEFDTCTSGTAFETIRELYHNAGYELPQVVFWNLQSRQHNVPVKYNQKGAALVSGFSPDIFKSVVKAEGLDPQKIMMQTIMNDRYDIWSKAA